MRHLFFAFVLSLLSAAAAAQTVYVSDVFFVPIRSGAGTQFRVVHQGLKSGTEMTRLEESEDKEWALVRTDGGVEGWIQTQYVATEAPARVQLGAAQTKLAAATKKIAELEEGLKSLQGEHSALAQTATDQVKERDQFAEELRQMRALSEDAVNLNQRYQDLLEKHELMQTEFDTVRAENDRLKANHTINQWMFGAGLVVFGMILMLILPAFSRPKRHSDWVN